MIQWEAANLLQSPRWVTCVEPVCVARHSRVRERDRMASSCVATLQPERRIFEDNTPGRIAPQPACRLAEDVWSWLPVDYFIARHDGVDEIENLVRTWIVLPNARASSMRKSEQGRGCRWSRCRLVVNGSLRADMHSRYSN